MNKASGCDNINSNTLKLIIDFVTTPITYVLNLCIENGYWPTHLKKAEIIPIFKEGDKHLMTNYRPISLISNIAKIFEKVVYSRLANFIHQNKILADNQFGFVEKRGTNDALLKVTELIYESIDQSKPTIATFLDLKKAFDTVNHDILIRRLSSYGVRGLALNLLSSYLTDRTQSAKIDNKKSNSYNVTMGVPQGTILGPLLFILYINELLKLLPSNLVSYADDTVIIFSGNSWKEVQDKMNSTLEVVGDWLSSNQLSLNATKSVYMAFSTRKKNIPNNINIQIHGIKLNSVDNYKYLGVIFDSLMKWENHILNITNRTKYMLFVLHKLKHQLLPTTLVSIYYALFQSIANYGLVAWGGAYKKYLNPIFNLQKRLTKIIHNKCEKKILNIKESYIVNSIVYYYNGLKNSFLNNKNITRKKSIILPKSKKNIGFNRSYMVAIKNFNKLPNNLKIHNTDAKNLKLKINKVLFS